MGIVRFLCLFREIDLTFDRVCMSDFRNRKIIIGHYSIVTCSEARSDY